LKIKIKIKIKIKNDFYRKHSLKEMKLKEMKL